MHLARMGPVATSQDSTKCSGGNVVGMRGPDLGVPQDETYISSHPRRRLLTAPSLAQGEKWLSGHPTWLPVKMYAALPEENDVLDALVATPACTVRITLRH